MERNETENKQKTRSEMERMMDEQELIRIVDSLVLLPKETEWVEFKHNFHSPEEIGIRLSALANSAKLWQKSFAYLVFGIIDETHEIVGTTFRCKNHKKGGEELEMWLLNRLNPRIDVEMYDITYSPGIHLAIYRIPANADRPVSFLNESYIRVGSLTKLLKNYPDKEAKLWNRRRPLGQIEVKTGLTETDIVSLLSAETYFDLMHLPMPQTTHGIVERFKSENLVTEQDGSLSITMLGALVLAKDLTQFDSLRRKILRIIVYKGKNKVETSREYPATKGYAVGFEEYTNWINGQLPANEEIGSALRRDVKLYPEVSIRELLANALIHQSFEERGFPMLEIYSDRIEISNAGQPLIAADRFIDEYESRNDDLADLMRRLGFCEEKGSGMDKVIHNNELYQLPPLQIVVQDNRTVVKLFAYRRLAEMNRQERIQATYQHACLRYVSGEKMTNQSLRQRFGIDDRNYPMASRIIKDALQEGVIKDDAPEQRSRKFAQYIPFWA